MADRAEVGGVRIAELVATLSYAADLGLGQPMEHCMRQTVIAMRVADLVAAGDRDREATYYLGLLMNVYCHADAAEQARWFGDDISFKGDLFELLGMSTAQTISFLLRRLGSHGGGVERARRLATSRWRGRGRWSRSWRHTRRSARSSPAGSDWATRSASRLVRPMSSGTARATRAPAGEEICLPARLVQLAGPVEVFSRRHGVEAARRIARKHRGTLFDPAVADLFCEHAWELLDGLDEAASWDAVLDAEPSLARRVAGSDLDASWRRWPTWSI